MTSKAIGTIMLPVKVSNGKPADHKKYRHWYVDKEFNVYQYSEGYFAVRSIRMKSGKTKNWIVPLNEDDLKDLIPLKESGHATS